MHNHCYNHHCVHVVANTYACMYVCMCVKSKTTHPHGLAKATHTYNITGTHKLF